MANPRRQKNFRRTQSQRQLRRNKAQEDRLPSEEFSRNDLARMEAQARRMMERNRRSFDE